MNKVILVILDGAGDRPIAEFGGRTPLEEAATPNLDALALKGICGMMDPIGPGIKPGSDTAHLAILGYDPYEYYAGRGPYEVAGLGMKPQHGDVCFRVNMGTVDKDWVVVDRRAGRIGDTGEFAKLMNKTVVDGVEFILEKGTAYRLGMIMRGEGLSAAVSDADPKEVGKKIKKVVAVDESPEARFTAATLNKFLEEAYKRLSRLESNKMRREKGELEANMLLVRGAGVYPRIESFESKFRMSPVCVAGAGLYKGVARMLGMKVVEVAGATGTGDTNVKAKIEAAIKASREHEFVFVHIKAADSYGEDGDAVGKKKFLEKVDQGIAELVGLENVLVVVTADHSTPCAFKGHSGDPVPVVMVGEGVRTDAVTSFGERSCVAGGLGRIRGVEVMRLVINVLGSGDKFGA